MTFRKISKSHFSIKNHYLCQYFYVVDVSMYLRGFYFIVLFALSVLPAASQSAGDMHNYSSELVADQDKTHILLFRFRQNSGMLLHSDNNHELTLIGDVIKENKRLINNGGWKIWVESYCDDEQSPEQNRTKARQYSNVLKSYLITNCGLKEQNFITKNHSGSYNSQTDLVALSIGAHYPYSAHAELAKIDRSGVIDSSLGQFELQVMEYPDNANKYYFEIMGRNENVLKTMNSDSIRRTALVPQSQRGQSKSLFPTATITPSEQTTSSLSSPVIDTQEFMNMAEGSYTDGTKKIKKQRVPKSKRGESNPITGVLPVTSLIALSKMPSSSEAPKVLPTGVTQSTSAVRNKSKRSAGGAMPQSPLEEYAMQQQVVAAQQAERESKLLAQAEKETLATVKRQEEEFSRQKQRETSQELRYQRPPFSVFGFSINSLAAATLLPNLELQAYVGSRFSINVGVIYNAWEPFKSMKLTTKMAIISPEFRVFISGAKQFKGHYFGVFGLGGQYNMRLFSDKAEQGSIIGGGLSYGYIWDIGSNFHIDLGIAGGYFSRKFDNYSYGPSGYKYYNDSQTKAQFAPAKLKVSFIFRLNNRAKK